MFQNILISFAITNLTIILGYSIYFFSKHNLNSLAVAKPGLIELRFNKASQAVFEGLEDDTQQIFELDTPVIPD